MANRTKRCNVCNRPDHPDYDAIERLLQTGVSGPLPVGSTKHELRKENEYLRNTLIMVRSVLLQSYASQIMISIEQQYPIQSLEHEHRET